MELLDPLQTYSAVQASVLDEKQLCIVYMVGAEGLGGRTGGSVAMGVVVEGKGFICEVESCCFASLSLEAC